MYVWSPAVGILLAEQVVEEVDLEEEAVVGSLVELKEADKEVFEEVV